jgi:hypothetical protein
MGLSMSSLMRPKYRGASLHGTFIGKIKNLAGTA